MYDDVKSTFREYFIQYFFWEDFEESDLNDIDTYWIGWGATLSISDHYVSFETIKDIIKLEIPLDIYFDWYDYSLDNEYINIESYFKIRCNGTHEDFLQFKKEQEERWNSVEHQAETEKILQELKDKFIKDIS